MLCSGIFTLYKFCTFNRDLCWVTIQSHCQRRPPVHASRTLGMSMSEIASSTDAELFPIREVCRLTGINPVTLRAWERRYALVVPTRTESGHRLYSMADVERVRSILAWIERGVAVSKIGALLQSSSDKAAPVLADGEFAAWQGRVLDALKVFSEAELARLYGQLFSLYGALEIYREVLLPVWNQLLIAREQFGMRSQWLLLDTFLRGRVLQRLQLARRDGAPDVLLCAPQGQCHELEWLLAGLALQESGVSVQLHSAEQPLEELALVGAHSAAPVLLLLAQKPFATDWLNKPLAKLSLSLDCTLALAGAGSELAAERLAELGIAHLGNDWFALAPRLKRLLAEQLDT